MAADQLLGLWHKKKIVTSDYMACRIEYNPICTLLTTALVHGLYQQINLGDLKGFLMLFTFRTTKGVNNEVAVPGLPKAELLIDVQNSRVATDKGCIHHCCLEYITEGLETCVRTA